MASREALKAFMKKAGEEAANTEAQNQMQDGMMEDLNQRMKESVARAKEKERQERRPKPKEPSDFREPGCRGGMCQDIPDNPQPAPSDSDFPGIPPGPSCPVDPNNR